MLILSLISIVDAKWGFSPSAAIDKVQNAADQVRIFILNF